MSGNASDGNQVGAVGLQRELEALRQSAEFRGPVEPTDGREHAHNHFALIYESRAELHAAVVPFVRQGLERGERCIYVVEDDSDEARDVLSQGGIDVDAARESGALTFVSARETYLEGDSFDPEEMVAYYADVIDRANEAFEGLRVIAGTSWLDEVLVDDFMEYEGRVNTLFEERDATALCHYDRTELPPGVIQDVIRTHPHLIYDDTVCHNFYYTPPEELFDGPRPDDDVERMLETVRDRAHAKTAVAEHRKFLRELNEITASPDLSFEEKLDGLFELGCDWFDLELGAMARVDVEDEWFEVEYVSDDHDHFEPGVELELSETYCTAATDIKAAGSVSDPRGEGYDDIRVYQEFGIVAYLGTYIEVDGSVDRTFFFVSSQARQEPFSQIDRTSLELMGQWVKYELERRQYQRELEDTVDRLQQSNDRLKQFAYAASHDLQEPLRMVSSYLQLLEGERADDLDEQAREWIEFAVDGADRMRAMVEGLLAYSRVEQSEEAFELVDCDVVLERVIDDLRVPIEESSAEITTDSLPTVMADGKQLEQLFRNLVSNAIKYSGDEPPRLDIGADQRADRWKFTVADDGIGMDPHEIDRIFDVFERLHHDGHAGTGIGLALCQEIVENHGGRIWVESEPGEGSTFHVTLPRRSSD